MKIAPTSRSDIKSYLELRNGSRIDTYYPSSTWSPDSLARSLTVPILYLDETAFIRHIDQIYSSAQPTLIKAREQAIRNKYPHFILLTSTPNGVSGMGEFYYNLCNNAVVSDDLFEFDETTGYEKWTTNSTDLINNPNKNGFIFIKYSWKEDPTKDVSWYDQQRRELNFNQRSINQELDLVFVGSSNCIFDDDTLGKFISINKKRKIDLIHQSQLEIYTDELDKLDYYLIGVDTASSLKGAYNAVEIFSFKDFNQVGELFVRLGSFKKYGEVVDEIFQWMYSIVGDRIILCVENNSIGKAIIEHLIYYPKIKNFNYTQYLYKDRNKTEYGINTNISTKDMMISFLHDYLREDPSRVKSQNLISQLSSIERSGSGSISSKSFTDMFMAAAFCAYTRKMRMMEIAPLLQYTNQQIESDFFNNIKMMSQLANPRISDKSHVLSVEDDLNLANNDKEDLSFLSFFG